jgi:hypothetical protein
MEEYAQFAIGLPHCLFYPASIALNKAAKHSGQ